MEERKRVQLFCIQTAYTCSLLSIFGCQKRDLVAFTMRYQKTGSTERSLLTVEKNKKLKNLFWNQKWQSDQGKKGGKKGGRVNSLIQYKSRQQVGLKYGSLVGLKNKSYF